MRFSRSLTNSSHRTVKCLTSSSHAAFFDQRRQLICTFLRMPLSAFAVVIFARTLDASTDTANLAFVLGKSRVAPIKQQSVLKLELQAAVLGVRLLETVRKASSTQFQSVPFWADSCLVLDWIQSRNKLETFAANSVDESRQSTSPVDWRYVPTESNTADYGTRGLKPNDIKQKWTRPARSIFGPVTA